MVYHGNGFTFSDVYEMPIYLRQFYFKKLISEKEKESKAMNKSTSKSQPKIHRSNFRPLK